MWSQSSFADSISYMDMKMKMVHRFETFVFYNATRRFHKVNFYIILKTLGDVFIEIEDINSAIKVFKALKNLCQKW